MGAARFVLVQRRSAAGAWLVARPAPGGEGAVPTSVGLIAWRLLGGNNHELGRGARLFPDVAAAWADLQEVQARIDVLNLRLVPDPSQVRWRWRFTLDGEDVAVSARGYLRQRECQANADNFSAALPKATLLPLQDLGGRV